MARARRLTVERLEDRTAPANFGVPWPDPEHLTLSFVPDNTPAQSTLFQLLNTPGHPADWQAQWETAILQAFQTWAINANLDIGLVPDGGQDFGTPGPPQGDSRFGDIRIGTNSQLENDVVAVALPFDVAAGNRSGDVKLNPLYDFGIGTNYDLFSVFLHEAGHVLGLGENPDPSSAMYESFVGTRTGLSAQDISDLQALYGVRQPDSFDAKSPNDSFATATKILPSSGTIEADLTTFSDVDYYQFSGTGKSAGPATIHLQTSGLSLLQANVTVYNSAFQPIGFAAAGSPLNGDLTIQLSDLRPSSVFYIKVARAMPDDSVFGIGSYRLAVQTDAGGTSHGGNPNGNIPQGPPDKSAPPAPTISLQPKIYRSDDRFAYLYQGSLASSTSVASFRFNSPQPRDGGSSVMTVMVWATQPGGLLPRITITDSSGPGEVIVNEDGTYTIQLTNLAPHGSHTLTVSAADPSDPLQAGSYVLAIDFGTRPETLQDFVSAAVLDTAQPEADGTLHVVQSQLFHLVLSADAGGQSTTAAVQLTVTAADGKNKRTLTAGAGDALSATFVLTPGDYHVGFQLLADDGVPLTYSLRGLGLTDPIGPESLDTTLNPVGSTSVPTAAGGTPYWWEAGFFQFLASGNPPGIGSTGSTPPGDPGSSTTSSGDGSGDPVAQGPGSVSGNSTGDPTPPPPSGGNTDPPPSGGDTGPTPPSGGNTDPSPGPHTGGTTQTPVTTGSGPGSGAGSGAGASAGSSTPPGSGTSTSDNPAPTGGSGSSTSTGTPKASTIPSTQAASPLGPTAVIAGQVLIALPSDVSAFGGPGAGLDGTVSHLFTTDLHGAVGVTTSLALTTLHPLATNEAVGSGLGVDIAGLFQRAAAGDPHLETVYYAGQFRELTEGSAGRFGPIALIRSAGGLGLSEQVEVRGLDLAALMQTATGREMPSQRLRASLLQNGHGPRVLRLRLRDGRPQVVWQSDLLPEVVAHARPDLTAGNPGSTEEEAGAAVATAPARRDLVRIPSEAWVVPVCLIVFWAASHYLNDSTADEETARLIPRL